MGWDISTGNGMAYFLNPVPRLITEVLLQVNLPGNYKTSHLLYKKEVPTKSSMLDLDPSPMCVAGRRLRFPTSVLYPQELSGDFLSSAWAF